MNKWSFQSEPALLCVYLNVGLKIIVVSSLLMLASCDRGERHLLGEESARRSLLRSLEADTMKVPGLKEALSDKETATKFAEAILFRTYGEDKIVDERPYEAYLIDGYWIIRGTLPKDADGGTFEIIFSSGSGQVIKLTHYR